MRYAPVPKEHGAAFLEITLLAWLVHEIALEVGKYDLYFQALHHIVSAGRCRGIFGWASGRCQPLHHTCKKGDNYAQRHSVSLVHMWRASSLLKSFSPKFVSVFLLVVGCVGFCQYKGRKFSVGFLAYCTDIVKHHCGIDLFINSYKSNLFFHTAKVSWSNPLVFIFLPSPVELGQ